MIYNSYMNDQYYLKYLKYRNKYIALENQSGGSNGSDIVLRAIINNDLSVILGSFNQNCQKVICDYLVKFQEYYQNVKVDINISFESTNSSNFKIPQNSTPDKTIQYLNYIFTSKTYGNMVAIYIDKNSILYDIRDILFKYLQKNNCQTPKPKDLILTIQQGSQTTLTNLILTNLVLYKDYTIDDQNILCKLDEYFMTAYINNTVQHITIEKFSPFSPINIIISDVTNFVNNLQQNISSYKPVDANITNTYLNGLLNNLTQGNIIDKNNLNTINTKNENRYEYTFIGNKTYNVILVSNHLVASIRKFIANNYDLYRGRDEGNIYIKGYFVPHVTKTAYRGAYPGTIGKQFNITSITVTPEGNFNKKLMNITV